MRADLPILYNLRTSFEENFRNPPFSLLIDPPPRQWPPKERWSRFLGFPVASRIGAAACAVTTGKGIALLAQLGFDILTYKTIRRQACPSYPLPNIVYVDCPSPLTDSDLNKPIFLCTERVSAEKIAISNSFGNACPKPETLIEDIKFAKRSLSPGQVLLVSVYGEGKTLAEISAEFSETAHFAKQAGADIIELNLSCPNLLVPGEPIYHDAKAVYEITSQAVHKLIEIPVVVKIGLIPFPDPQLSEILEAIACAGAKGVSAINSIRGRVVDQTQKAVFGKRIFSGISGYPIRSLALQFIKRLAQLNQEKGWGLTILGIGGITLAEHFDDCLSAGADVALSATGMMWNPYLALQRARLPKATRDTQQ